MTPKMTQTSSTNNVVPQPSTGGDLREARLKMVTDPKLKNPLVIADPIDRQAATLAKIQRIMANPKYQAMSPEHQEKVRGKYYDKYVAPGYTGIGLPVPDRGTWIKGVIKHGFQPSDYYHGTSTTQALNLLAGAEDSSGSILKGTLNAGAWVGKEASLAYLGLNKYFTNASTDETSAVKVTVEEKYKQAQKVIDKISGDTITDAQFWMQTHPSKSLAGKADSFIGENIMQLGLYETIGGARGLIAPKNLTAALTTGSKTAKIVAAGLTQASDAFMGAIMQGKSHEEIAQDMAGFMGFGMLGEGASIAGSALIKKFTAQTLVHGGRPLVEAITSEAAHELNAGKIHGHPAPEGVAITPAHVTQALDAAHKDDPIKAKMVTASKVVLTSISKSNFGKTFKELTKEQQSKVRALHAEVTAAAVREMPVHVPEIAKANASAAVQSSMKEDSSGAAWDLAMQKKHGINVTETLHQAENEAVKKQTGIKSSQGTIKKINAARGKATAKNARPIPSATPAQQRRADMMQELANVMKPATTHYGDQALVAGKILKSMQDSLPEEEEAWEEE